MLREVKVENGTVRGLPAADPRITVFKGIPYAAPPVGENRWRAPQPAKDWEGVLEAYHFGPIAMQDIPGKDPNAFYSKEWHVDTEIKMSEDCLNLNVWTPAKRTDEKLPVMVWIHGGGQIEGYSSEMEFDGERIARRGVILVSMNYRLNAFGFLAHPEITAEDPDYPTNFGHLDQRFAFQWVKRNIAAFGGDPENVTIFGQSAGGCSTFVHIASPLNKGLFQKAICQSHGGLVPSILGSKSLEEAEQAGVRFFERMGVKTLAEARELDAKVILDQFFKTDDYFFRTVIGDKMVPDKPSYVMMENKRNDVIIMTGCTGDETPCQPFGKDMDAVKDYAEYCFGERAGEYLDIITRGTDDLNTIKENGKYYRFDVGNKIWADVNVRHNVAKMYMYKFNPEIPGEDNPGTFHSSDLWFCFETLAKCHRPFKGKHYDLARQMCNYWTNFAKNGDPNGLDADGTPMPEWRPVTENDRQYMYFGDTPAMNETERTEVENFVISYYDEKLSARENINFQPFVSADGEILK